MKLFHTEICIAIIKRLKIYVRKARHSRQFVTVKVVIASKWHRNYIFFNFLSNGMFGECLIKQINTKKGNEEEKIPKFMSHKSFSWGTK